MPDWPQSYYVTENVSELLIILLLLLSARTNRNTWPELLHPALGTEPGKRLTHTVSVPNQLNPRVTSSLRIKDSN